MLVFTRKAGESIMVGNVEVLIVSITRNRVSISIKAPRKIPVHRKEIYDSIQHNKETK